MKKPKAVAEYNKYMKGVNQADQLLSYYGFSHRKVKWWHRAFFYLLDSIPVSNWEQLLPTRHSVRFHIIITQHKCNPPVHVAVFRTYKPVKGITHIE